MKTLFTVPSHGEIIKLAEDTFIEPMENKVYVVTSGQYSDYGINAIFSTRERALDYIQAFDTSHKYDTMNIEEHELDVLKPEGRRAFKVRLDGITGDVISVGIASSSYSFDIGNEFYKDVGGDFFGNVLAKDKEHAIKIVSEKKLTINNA
jgi:hypothetical protein